MFVDHWPPAGLRLTTPRLRLQVPDLERLAELGELAAAGVHDPQVQPFVVPWTDAGPADRVRGTLQWHWGTWASWQPGDWELGLVAITDEEPAGARQAGRAAVGQVPPGTVVGMQSLSARDFAGLREVGTGSWLGRAYQGRGYGTEMRAAVLELAFRGLGADQATTEAFADNHASYRVSRKLGYVDDGIARHLVRDRPVTGRRLRLDRAGWAAARTVPVRIEGLAACREMFGTEDPTDPGRD